MDIKRLKWATRRGMLELDLILLPFLENHYESLDEENKLRFQQLLDCQDPELFDWFMGKSIPENPDHKFIVKYILECIRETAD